MYPCGSPQDLATFGLYLFLLSGALTIFAEVDVCSCQTYGTCNTCSSTACSTVNIALGKVANASRLYNSTVYNEVSGPPCLVVNGNTGTTFRPINTNPDSPACVHTDPNDNSPYWEVDLGQQYVISTITVYGREENISLSSPLTDTFNTLRKATVTVDNSLCYTFSSDYFRPIDTQITCRSPLTGRKVRIQKIATDIKYFALCQVQVWVCSDGYYGSGCTNTCGHCLVDTCDRWSGECPQGCSTGYQGTHCRDLCSSGAYGVNCKEKCGNCTGNSPCNIYDGRCETGCAVGYKPPLCTDVCSDGSYGLNCSNACGNCKGNSPCNIYDGRCESGCVPGYKPPSCKQVCSTGLYGVNCTNMCGSCSEGTTCDSAGECPEGCNLGYQGIYCNEPCRGTYGAGCNETCGRCSGGSECNIFTGHCETGCEAGYYPPFCSQACSQPHDINRDSASCAGPVAGAVVGSFAVSTVGFLLAILLMRYRHRQGQDKMPSAACFSAPLQTGPVGASSFEPEVSSNYENTTVSTNVYDSLTVSRDDNTVAYTTLTMKRTGDVSSFPDTNIT